MKIKGFLESMNEKGIWGWAMDQDSREAVEVHLYINDQFVASRMATRHRAPLQEKGIHPTGNCGFSFPFKIMDLDTREPASPYLALTIKAGPDQQVLRRTLIYEKKGFLLAPSVEKEALFFVHIPKTAGSAFRFFAEKNFPSEAVYANDEVMKQFGGFFPNYNDYLRFAMGNPSPPQFWVGHIPFILGKYLSPEHRSITFLRDPVKRVVSALVYLQQTLPLFQNMSLEDIFEQNKYTRFFNLQTRYFADTEINRLPYFENKKRMDEKGLDAAMRNLSDCDFVGITERFEESMAMIAEQFDLQFPDLERINETPNKEQIVVPEAILQEIPELIKYDSELYLLALELFKKQREQKKNPFF